MPIYEVEIQRTTTEIHYATVTVEAESKEDAEMLAIKSEDSNWENMVAYYLLTSGNKTMASGAAIYLGNKFFNETL